MAISQGKNSYMTTWRLIQSGGIVPFLRVGPKSSLLLYSVFRPIDMARKIHMKGKSFTYIQIIGVSADNQGKGVGGRLLQSLITMSDESKLPIYLETGTGSNVRLYERFGFKTLEKIMLPIINQPMWAMIREVKRDKRASVS